VKVRPSVKPMCEKCKVIRRNPDADLALVELASLPAGAGELRLAAVKTFGGHDHRTEAFEIYFTEILTPAASKR